MPTSTKQKMKLIYLIKIFSEQSDEDHSLSMNELIKELAKYDIQAERKSIYSDIEYLQEFGYDIVRKHSKGFSYYLGERDFQLPELKLLVDAVQSSQFITKKKSEDLIRKFSKLASRHQAKELNRQVIGINKAKTFNERIYYNINEIHNAINNGKKISFRYFDLDLNITKNFRKQGQAYNQTPLTLFWNDDKYYLICYSEKYDSLVNYRVDRMDDVVTNDDNSDKFDRRKHNVSEHLKSQFGMYSGEVVKATLRFDKAILNPVLDRFGTSVFITPLENHFEITVDVALSPVFLGWIFQFGDKAEIVSPDSLRQTMNNLLQELLLLYK